MGRLEEIKARAAQSYARDGIGHATNDVEWLVERVEEAQKILDDYATGARADQLRRARAWLSKVEEAT